MLVYLSNNLNNLKNNQQVVRINNWKKNKNKYICIYLLHLFLLLLLEYRIHTILCIVQIGNDLAMELLAICIIKILCYIVTYLKYQNTFKKIIAMYT